MQYQVKTVTEKVDWAQIERIDIMNYPWGSDYMPHTSAWLYRVEGEGFYLKMRCEENEPKAVPGQPRRNRPSRKPPSPRPASPGRAGRPLPKPPPGPPLPWPRP